MFIICLSISPMACEKVYFFFLFCVSTQQNKWNCRFVFYTGCIECRSQNFSHSEKKSSADHHHHHPLFIIMLFSSIHFISCCTLHIYFATLFNCRQCFCIYEYWIKPAGSRCIVVSKLKKKKKNLTHTHEMVMVEKATTTTNRKKKLRIICLCSLYLRLFCVQAI